MSSLYDFIVFLALIDLFFGASILLFATPQVAVYKRENSHILLDARIYSFFLKAIVLSAK